VIHGNHTATGKPLLATDPHLSSRLPSNWYLMGFHVGEMNSVGGSYPGVMFLGQGKSNYIAWGQTAPLNDVSDVFKEKLNEDETKYFVDGKWRDLTIITEEIKVKG